MVRREKKSYHLEKIAIQKMFPGLFRKDPQWPFLTSAISILHGACGAAVPQFHVFVYFKLPSYFFFFVLYMLSLATKHQRIFLFFYFFAESYKTIQISLCVLFLLELIAVSLTFLRSTTSFSIFLLYRKGKQQGIFYQNSGKKYMNFQKYKSPRL